MNKKALKNKLFSFFSLTSSFLLLLSVIGLKGLKDSKNKVEADELSWTYQSDFPVSSEQSPLPSEWKNVIYGTTASCYVVDGFATIGNDVGGIKHIKYQNPLNLTDFLVETDAKMQQVSDTSNSAVIGFSLAVSSNSINSSQSTQLTHLYIGANGKIVAGTYFSKVGPDFANSDYAPFDLNSTGKVVTQKEYNFAADYPAILTSLKNGETLHLSLRVLGRDVTLSINETEMFSYTLNEKLDDSRCLGLVSRGVYTIASYSNIKILDYEEAANRPNLKIGFISDVHIGAKDNNETYFRKVLNGYKTSNIDMIIINGDLGHHLEPRGTKGAAAIVNQQKFADIINEIFPDKDDRPELLITIGNHDRYAFEDVKGRQYEHEEIKTFWENNFGYTVDSGTPGLNCIQKVKGYTFVSGIIDSPISERMALIDQAIAMPENAGKPIFYVQHEMPNNTIYISETTDGDAEIDSYLNAPNYQNVIFLGAHSHNPLSDERSIYQKGYTLFAPGALFGPIVLGGNYYSNGAEKGSFQTGWYNYKAGTILNIFDEVVKVERWDYVKDEKIGIDWEIDIKDGKIDLEKYNYDNRKASAVAPIYQNDAKVETENISPTVEKITFDSCDYDYLEKNDIVVQYEVAIKQGSDIISTQHICSTHYRGRGYEKGQKYSIEVSDLRPGIQYDVFVYAQDSFLLNSNPITASFMTGEEILPGIDNPSNILNKEEMKEQFDFFSNTSSGFLENNEYFISNSQSSLKMVSKNVVEGSGGVETTIALGSDNALLNAGVYVYANNPGNDIDQINAWNIEIESAAGSRDLKVNLYRFENLAYKNCPAGTTLSNFFEDGAKKDQVRLKVYFDNGFITVLVNDSKLFTYNTKTTIDGKVGIRSFFTHIKFKEFKIFEFNYHPDLSAYNLYLNRLKSFLDYKTSVDGSDIRTDELYLPTSEKNKIVDILEEYGNESYQFAKNKIQQATDVFKQTIEEANDLLAFGNMDVEHGSSIRKSSAWMFVAIPSLSLNVVGLTFLVILIIKRKKKN